jgi:uncharacterized protein
MILITAEEVLVAMETQKQSASAFSPNSILKVSIPLLIIYAAIGQAATGYLILKWLGIQEPILDLAQHLYQFACATILLLIIPWIIFHKHGMPFFEKFGTTKGNWALGKWLLLISPIAIPIMWIGSNDPALIAEYPLSKEVLSSVGFFIIYELIYGFFYYIPYEFHFRGMLQTGLSQTWKPWQSILFVTLVTTALHWMKPMSEIISAFVVGFFFGYIAYKTKSWLYVFEIHFLVGILSDTFCGLRFLGII